MTDVFSPDQVARLWLYQFGPWRDLLDDRPSKRNLPLRMHPFTCANRGDGRHPPIGEDHGILIPTVRGWICQFCDYTQDWAHDFMKDSAQGIGTQRAETPQEAPGAKRVEPGPAKQDAP